MKKHSFPLLLIAVLVLFGCNEKTRKTEDGNEPNVEAAATTDNYNPDKKSGMPSRRLRYQLKLVGQLLTSK